MQLSDDAAREIRAARKRRGWTVADVARRCAGIGHPELTANTIENIESGRRVEGRRRRAVTVDELFAFADALQVQAGVLLPDLRPKDMRHDALCEAIAALERLRDGD